MLYIHTFLFLKKCGAPFFDSAAGKLRQIALRK